jgi:hypothetical protein
VDESETQLVNDVNEYGWHMITVPPDDQGPGFTYTIGLFKSYGHPEVIIFGLPIPVMQGVLDVVAEIVKDGRRFVDGEQTDDVMEGYACAFRTVHRDHYRGHFGFAIWFYRTLGQEAFPALQCIWPDKGRRFPWERDCLESIHALQPLLYEPPP